MDNKSSFKRLFSQVALSIPKLGNLQIANLFEPLFSVRFILDQWALHIKELDKLYSSELLIEPY